MPRRAKFSPRPGTPIDVLPPELLSYIFELSSFDYGPLDNDRSQHYLLPFGTETIRPPVVFSAVCQHWRQVAHDTGSIWSRICITAELLDDKVPISQAELKTAYIASFLKLSHNRSLDIVIDARDPFWDFSEPEVQTEDLSHYLPPFSAAHMTTAMDLLLPHLHRWRSLDIMTDTWVPMHKALIRINEHISNFGASFSRLESLTLMRCNDYSSYAPVFEPIHLKTPSFLDTSSSTHKAAGRMPLLQNLVLRGVHVDWSSLPSLLPEDPTKMRFLELGSHARDVRPNEFHFRDILSSCPSLERLSIDGSGPFELDAPPPSPSTASPCNKPHSPIPLHHLQELSLGYRSVAAGQKLFELLDIPNLQKLSLSDTTNPIDPLDVDASSLLRYIGAGYMRPPGLPHLCAHSDQQPHHSSQRCTICHHAYRSNGPFPGLRHLSLCGTKASLQFVQEMFKGLANLGTVELSSVSIDIVRALRGSSETERVTFCPCPVLRRLVLKELDCFGQEQMEEVVEIDRSRVGKGGLSWDEVEVKMKRGMENATDDVKGVVERHGWVSKCSVAAPDPFLFPSDMEEDAYYDEETEEDDDDENAGDDWESDVEEGPENHLAKREEKRMLESIDESYYNMHRFLGVCYM